jgi:methylmalonyl-CoA mutase cobalamin-binding subunit
MMKNARTPSLLELVSLGGALLLVSAHSTTAQTPTRKTDPVARQTEVRQLSDRAIAVARNGDIASAEQVLSSLNRSKPNTADWHLETSQRLVQMAERLQREARPAVVSSITARILTQLESAERLASDGRSRADALHFAGFVHERFNGDLTAALASYRAAARYQPDSPAKEAADRLERAMNNVNSRAKEVRP